ncbi:uncharacterized protein K02A2.6-like [Eupeodes corollae]|uniref:uncharacterized protein K02A2.6-like n=1 Tax=Eupeodes corollae TaxID=290404 RepID=UPI002490CE91|nr:uncharacterized protein K02A2.6-like [Eupeodes corollae]
MSSQSLGKLEEYEPGEDFESYEDRLRIYFQLNEIKEERKALILLSLIGKNTYAILKNLVQPKKPNDISFDKLVSALRDHFAPRVNIRAERYKFNKAFQREGESITEFIIRLKSLASTCGFGNFLEDLPLVVKTSTKCCKDFQEPEIMSPVQLKSRALDDALTDRFIAGIMSEDIQRQLLNNSKLNFEECCELGLNMEMSRKEAHAIRPNQSAEGCHRVFQQSSSSGSTKKDSNKKEKRMDHQAKYTHKKVNCHRCGRQHNPSTCPAINWKCFTCNRLGHTSIVCRNKTTKAQSKINVVDQIIDVDQINSVKSAEHALFSIKVENQLLCMEVDTGACSSLIGLGEYNNLFSKIKLEPCIVDLCSVTGQKLTCKGKIKVQVECHDKMYELELIVIEANREFKPLLGRSWLDVLVPDWRTKLFGNLDISELKVVKKVSNDKYLDVIRKDFKNIIDPQPKQSIKGFEMDIILKENVVPVFHKPYEVPFRIKDKVREELNRLISIGALEPVKYSLWASPIVCVPKSSGEVRICVDFRLTLNKNIVTQHYPLPKIEDIFASLSECRVFCIIDLSGAYQQLVVSKACVELLTINTFMGLLRFVRCPAGLKNAPSAFQSVMDRILKGLPNVFCFIDDILVGGVDQEDCHANLLRVLNKLSEHNVQINPKKCKFFVETVDYLGHSLSNGSISPNNEKIKAVVDAPAPKNVQQLQSYLGMLNYYSKFIPNLSSQLKELYGLLKKGSEFIWSPECQNAFQKSKYLLSSNKNLELYDPKKPIVVATDASPYGVGAVMSHICDGVEKPVMFISSTLSSAEKNYSQLHKEALAIVFAVKKFHKYLYGKEFLIVSDHQALREIFNPKKGMSGVAAARLQRWAIILSMYDYRVEYRKGSLMANADACSRLPLEGTTGIEEVKMVNMIKNCSEELNINSQEVAKKTQADPILKKVFEYVFHHDWPKSISDDIAPYFRKRNSLSTENQSIFYGNRVVIPLQLQKSVLNMIHGMNHAGVVKMKCLARGYVWWHMIDEDIAKVVQQCPQCQSTANVPRGSFSPWPKCSSDEKYECIKFNK